MNGLKSKLKCLFEEIVGQHFRLNSQTAIQLPSVRLGSFNDSTEGSAIDSVVGEFRKFAESVSQQLRDRKTNQQYQQLEKSLQTQEAQIRNHIRLEQQMKLYAESLQAKLQDSEKTKAESSTSNAKTVLNLRKQIDKLQEQYRGLKDRDTGTLVVTQSNPYYSSKQRGYGSTRCDTQNRKTPVKDQKQKQPLQTSSSFLSRVQIPYNDITNSVHAKTQNDQKHRSVSRQEGIRRNMKGSSIHILSKKNNLSSNRKY